MFSGWAPRLLLLGGNGGVDVEVVADEVWVDPWSVQASHANTSIFLLRNLTSSSFSWGGNLAPTWKNFSASPSMTTLSRSSHFASSAAISSGGAGAFDCYKSSSSRAEDSTSSRCEMVATMHCLAVGWQPRISRTRSPDGTLPFSARRRQRLLGCAVRACQRWLCMESKCRLR